MRASTEAIQAARATRMPDFFIVGHAKCGTSALYEMLRLHPQIFMPKVKEPWYFSRSNPQALPASERTVEVTGNVPMGEEEYLALFADATPGQRIGEGSTSYLWSPTAAAAIAAVQPAARIIAILREPAIFLRSLHLQLLTNATESEKDFRKALALDDARRQGREIPRYAVWPGALIYSDRVRYVEQLRRYHAVLPREQVLVLIYDDFRADNEATVRRVLRFLDVDDGWPVQLVEAHRSDRHVRSRHLNELARVVQHGRGPVSGALKSAVRGLSTREQRARWLYPIKRRIMYRDPGSPDDEFMTELRRRFKPEVVAASEYLERDLVTLWGYDRLD
jgi:hypothetical protein